ncbi:hypothetical protein BDZ91DRAFT_201709 [Kalaharituber pfeilii]|nr:hypothetical protein BDZ91DRAFT_201709 [Kalaharituber pfeilii]
MKAFVVLLIPYFFSLFLFLSFSHLTCQFDIILESPRECPSMYPSSISMNWAPSLYLFLSTRSAM